MPQLLTRRRLLVGAALAAPTRARPAATGSARARAFATSCSAPASGCPTGSSALIGSQALAREFDPSEMSPRFRTNGNTRPRSEEYQLHVAEPASPTGGSQLDGLVGDAARLVAGRAPGNAGAQPDHPPRLRRGLERDRQVDRRAALRTCSTRPGCSREARYIVFHCADDFSGTVPTTRASTSSTPSTRRRSSPTA